MKRSILFLLFVFSIQFLLAQKGFQEFDFFKMGGQFPNGTISAIEFDDSNNVWMGQGLKVPLGQGFGGGLWKFDGKDISLISNNLVNSSSRVLALLFHNNKLWIGTKAGLISYDKSNNSWQKHDTIQGPVSAIKFFDDVIYVGSIAGYYKFDINTEKKEYIPTTNWISGQSVVYDIAIENKSTIWLATSTGLVKEENNQYKIFNSQNSVLNTDVVTTVLWNEITKKLWVGAQYFNSSNAPNGGLFIVSNDNVNSFEEIYPCFGISTHKFAAVHSIKQDNKGNIYVNGPYNRSRNSQTFSKITPTDFTGYFINSERQGKLQPMSTDNTGMIGFDNNDKIWFVGDAVSRLFRVDDIDLLPKYITNDAGKDEDKPQNLDINQVDAWMLNRGDMFWDNVGNNRYIVPKGSCKSPLLAASLWIGGKDANNKIHLAAMEYRFNGADYSPGPLDTVTIKGDTTGRFTKIWKVSKWEVEEFKQKFAAGEVTNGNYTPYGDFMSWPANGSGGYARNLAPFVDVDNNNIYEPLKGDYPKIKGEETLYWMFNDNTYPHTESEGSTPLGVEVHAMAYAYNCDTIKLGSPNEALNYTTFYEYRIINRSDTAYDSTFVGLWTDPDLGNPNDDFVGSNKDGNFAFTYNADNDDETHKGYGKNPPMLNTVFLSDPLHSFLSYSNDFSVTGIPTYYGLHYNYLRGVWKDESPITYGGNGYKTGAPTKLMYPGTPYSSDWVDSTYFQNGDRRYIQSAGPFTLQPKQEKNFSFAIVYSYEPNAPNGINTSWAKNLRDVKAVQGWYTNQNFPSCPTKPIGLSIGSELENPLQAIKVVPNPFSGSTSLIFNLSQETKGTVQVYNMLGQVVQSIPLTQYNSGENTVKLDIANQPTGMYMYILKTEGGQYTGKMVNANK
jgi:hypothetical protein